MPAAPPTPTHPPVTTIHIELVTYGQILQAVEARLNWQDPGPDTPGQYDVWLDGDLVGEGTTIADALKALGESLPNEWSKKR